MKPTLHVPPELRNALGADPFATVRSLVGEIYRQHKHRRTFRCTIGGSDYFVKYHGHAGWREILKDGLRGRTPIVTADAEWRAIERCHELGVPTVSAVAYGTRGATPATRESFIITEPLDDFVHLDDACERIANLTPAARFRFKRKAILETAAIARTLHRAGLNHRDFYLCHFMLPEQDWSTLDRNAALELHVIDLHRMQQRSGLPARWIVKDLGGLLFSALDVPVTQLDCLRFLRAYWGDQWRARIRTEASMLRRIVRRARLQYRAHHGKPARVPAGLASF